MNQYNRQEVYESSEAEVIEMNAIQIICASASGNPSTMGWGDDDGSNWNQEKRTMKKTIVVAAAAAGYTAVYGTMSDTQTYSATAGKLPMSGVSDSVEKTKLSFTPTNSTGGICFKTATDPMAIENNKIQPVTLSGITFSAPLPGEFSINVSTKVKFSKGNLYAKKVKSVWTWGFCDDQYMYNFLNTSMNRDATSDDTGIDHSCWGYDAAGCVFLPAAGSLSNSRITHLGMDGTYWSSTSKYTNTAYGIFFSGYNFWTVGGNYDRSMGYSVRLVCICHVKSESSGYAL